MGFCGKPMQEFASSICAVASSRRVGDECFYTQELFEKEEFTGHLKNTMESEKSTTELRTIQLAWKRDSLKAWKRMKQ